eukprot:TRINITY_DN3399_c1_g2_i8.p1 TRINITY_DN3399_c1_g2~~TRINITY_DN3399_c1_g2_i8.p1  ORF type:complete len:253 (+),score=30.65 TRINITY_DN3399_c1_g2_i8:71-829(+)
MSTGLLLFVSVDSREGAPAPLEAEPDWTVGQLKKSALTTAGFDVESTVATLLFAGKELQDRQLLADSGVSSEATLELRTQKRWSLGWSGAPWRVSCSDETPASPLPVIDELMACVEVEPTESESSSGGRWVDVLPELQLPSATRESVQLWVTRSRWNHYAGARLSGSRSTAVRMLPFDYDESVEQLTLTLQGYSLTITDSETAEEFDLSDWGPEKVSFGAYVYSARARVSLEAWEGPRGPLSESDDSDDSDG